MTSPNINEPRRPSLTTSPRTGLLPSPFSHSDEALPQGQSLRFSSTGGPDPPLFPVNDDYSEPGDGSLLPPQGFAPFFTMITDAGTGETYHPSTYYVFQDDEPDVLSSAALHALDAYSPLAVQDAEAKALIDGTPREEERYILLDMGSNGANVVSARSLAPTWAVTNAEVRAAPTFDGEGSEGSDGLMLMVEGLSSGAATSVPPPKSGKERQATAKESFDDARKKSGGDIIKAMEDLAQGMIGGLRTLDEVATLD